MLNTWMMAFFIRSLDWKALEFFKPEQQTRDLVLRAVKTDVCAMFLARTDFREDGEIMMEVIRQNMWDFLNVRSNDIAQLS